MKVKDKMSAMVHMVISSRPLPAFLVFLLGSIAGRVYDATSWKENVGAARLLAESLKLTPVGSTPTASTSGEYTISMPLRRGYCLRAGLSIPALGSREKRAATAPAFR